MNEINTDCIYDQTVELYNNRHRKLTISRIVKETDLSWNFVSSFAIRKPANVERIQKLREYLLKYKTKPELV